MIIKEGLVFLCAGTTVVAYTLNAALMSAE